MKRLIKLQAGEEVPDDAKFLGGFMDISHYVANPTSDGKMHSVKDVFKPFFFYEIEVNDNQEKSVSITENQFDEAWEKYSHRKDLLYVDKDNFKKELGF